MSSVAPVGLSPPTRGSRRRYCDLVGLRRSIPAHAGEPCSPARPHGSEWAPMDKPRAGWVYPRPRGGAVDATAISWAFDGLSPPTRGSHVHQLDRTAPSGSIPAHEPMDKPEPGTRPRSIPAHAGEPPSRTRRCSCPAVYPRPRGGASHEVSPHFPEHGLSPPTRGSRFRLR